MSGGRRRAFAVDPGHIEIQSPLFYVQAPYKVDLPGDMT
jgi:hypothetical protein